MNRTAEVIFTIIGMLIYFFVGLMGVFTTWMYYNQDQVSQMLEDVETNDDLTTEEFLTLLSEIGTTGWYIIVIAVIALIIGGVAIYFLRHNRNAKIAGVLLLIMSVTSVLASFGLAFIAAIAYFISGIMSLIRKPKTQEMI